MGYAMDKLVVKWNALKQKRRTVRRDVDGGGTVDLS